MYNMSLTRKIHRGGMKTKVKKGKGHCTKGGKSMKTKNKKGKGHHTKGGMKTKSKKRGKKFMKGGSIASTSTKKGPWQELELMQDDNAEEDLRLRIWRELNQKNIYAWGKRYPDSNLLKDTKELIIKVINK